MFIFSAWVLLRASSCGPSQSSNACPLSLFPLLTPDLLQGSRAPFVPGAACRKNLDLQEMSQKKKKYPTKTYELCSRSVGLNPPMSRYDCGRHGWQEVFTCFLPAVRQSMYALPLLFSIYPVILFQTSFWWPPHLASQLDWKGLPHSTRFQAQFWAWFNQHDDGRGGEIVLGLVVNDCLSRLSSAVWCQRNYFTAPKQVTASINSNHQIYLCFHIRLTVMEFSQ